MMLSMVLICWTIGAPAPFLKPALPRHGDGSRVVVIDGTSIVIPRNMNLWPGNRYHLDHPGWVETGWWYVEDGKIKLSRRELP